MGDYDENVSPEKEDTPLMTRVKRANAAKVNYYVSIHYNAIGDNWDDAASGVETYCYKFGGEGEKLARAIHAVVKKGRVQKDRGVKEGNFCVIRETSMPAVLIEFGFMSNHKEAEWMLDKAFQEECAEQTCEGICNYLKKTYIPKPTKIYKVQVGAFTTREKAEDLVKELKAKGYEAIVV